jgi:hypothetical protein
MYFLRPREERAVNLASGPRALGRQAGILLLLLLLLLLPLLLLLLRLLLREKELLDKHAY